MKVLISRPDKVGDVVLALHGVKQLKALIPECQVYIHVAEYTRGLVDNIAFLDGVVTIGEDLKPYKFDASVDLMAKSHVARMYAKAGIPLRIGNLARWHSFYYNRFRTVRRSRAFLNEAEYNWQLLSLLDDRLRHTRLRSALTIDDFKDIPEVEDVQGATILMPGASVSAEAWPHERWQELARSLSERGQRVLILLGPAEEKMREMYDKLSEDYPTVRTRLVTSLSVVLGILKNARFYVGPSTGITHLASVARVSGVALYPVQRSMHPDRWAPFQSSLRTLYPASQVSARDVELALDQCEAQKPGDRERVSAFIICKNEEEKIARCIDSISWCDEILVVDSGSTDRTLEICRSFSRVRVIEREWPGHREQKQFALSQCKYPWVLNLDADEELSSELKAEIMKILRDSYASTPVVKGYYLCRLVYFLDRWWDRGGWHPEYRLRFLWRESATWGGVNPHEKAFVDGATRKLKGYLYHYTYDSYRDLIQTLNRFSTLSANALYERGVRANMKKLVFHPPMRFIKFYFFRLGFIEGIAGMQVAFAEAFSTFLKYAKLLELQQAEESEG